MPDPKLTASILDLSRNVNNLTAEVKKNTSAVETSIKSSAESTDKTPEKIESQSQNDLTNQIRELNSGLKGLDFKGLFENFKSLKKGILGNLEKGGMVSKSGNYIVGEKGPEVVQLQAGNKVIPNKNTSANDLVRFELESKSKLQKKIPSSTELEAQRLKILQEDPDLANDPSELARELKYFVENYDRGTFSREDIAKLSKPVRASEAITPVSTGEIIRQEKTKREIRRERKEKRKEGKKNPLPNTEPITPNQVLGGESPEEKRGGLAKIGQFLGKQLRPKPQSGLIGGETFGFGGGINKRIIPELQFEAGIGKKEGTLESTLKSSSPEVGVLSKLRSTKGELGKESFGKESATLATAKVLDSLEKKLTESLFSGKKIDQFRGDKDSEEKPSKKTTSSEMGSAVGISKEDIDQIKSALGRIAILLEGPLSVAPLDYPFRPDSRRV